MFDPDVDWLLPVEVTRHAVERARHRCDPRLTEREIHTEVVEGLRLDRAATRFPSWCKGVGDYGPLRAGIGRDDEEDLVYVWNEQATRAWALLLETGPRRLVVRTVLCADGYRYRPLEREGPPLRSGTVHR